MLTIRNSFCFSLLYYCVCGILIRPLKYETTTAQQTSPATPPPDIQCAPEKSLHSTKDLQAMIDHVYSEKPIDKIKQDYQSKAEAIRNKHMRDLKGFTDWFINQPEHLKHILQSLAALRKEHVEPTAQKVSAILSEYPKLEMMYNEKNNKTNELIKKLKRYENICLYNSCNHEKADNHEKVHNVTKRSTQNDFYCSSLQDLYNEVFQKFDEFLDQLNNELDDQLSSIDKVYEENIAKLKSKLKDNALKKFGRTMYDILSLQDEYHHFMDDITSIDLNEKIYTMKDLGLQIDTKLLHLEKTVENYGRYCNSCSSKLSRKVKRTVLQSEEHTEGHTVLQSEEKIKAEEGNIVTELMAIKIKEIFSEIENDLTNLFSDLNALIEKADDEEFSVENLKPLQDEVKLMTEAEKEELNELKNLVPVISIKVIVEWLKKLDELLKFIISILDKIPFP